MSSSQCRVLLHQELTTVTICCSLLVSKSLRIAKATSLCTMQYASMATQIGNAARLEAPGRRATTKAASPVLGVKRARTANCAEPADSQLGCAEPRIAPKLLHRQYGIQPGTISLLPEVGRPRSEPFAAAMPSKVLVVPMLCREGAGAAAREDLEQQVAVLQQRCDALQAEVGRKAMPQCRLRCHRGLHAVLGAHMRGNCRATGLHELNCNSRLHTAAGTGRGGRGLV